MNSLSFTFATDPVARETAIYGDDVASRMYLRSLFEAGVLYDETEWARFNGFKLTVPQDARLVDSLRLEARR